MYMHAIRSNLMATRNKRSSSMSLRRHRGSGDMPQYLDQLRQAFRSHCVVQLAFLCKRRDFLHIKEHGNAHSIRSTTPSAAL
jgi:hypothetical protein